MNGQAPSARSAILAAAFLLLAACAFADGQVRKRAASEFGCPIDDVWVDSAEAGYIAHGCYKEADYSVADGQVKRTSGIRPMRHAQPPLPIDRIPNTNSVGL